MLPRCLLLLLQVVLPAVLAQQHSLSLGSLTTLGPPSPTGTPLSNPATFSLPSSRNLSVSIALCESTSSPPQFFLTNDSSVSFPSASNLGSDVFEIALQDGFGSWTGPMEDGGVLAIDGLPSVKFEVGVSDSGPHHEILDTFPFLGDTTGNQALLFSHNISAPLSDPAPTYPNYTLPPANRPYPTFPGADPHLTLFVAPTDSSSLSSLPRTGCAMRQSDSALTISSEGAWLRDSNGWRWQWLVSGLNSLTNYTVYVVQNGTKLTRPANFVTKSVSFPCPLVHSLPFCPSVNYAVPLPLPANTNTITANTLPASISDPLLSYLANFTVSLLTFPCGRDVYSPIVSCADCQAAYRTWLCLTSFPRCAEAASASTSASTASASSTSGTPTSALAAQPTSAPPRNPSLGNFTSDYTALLPCIEVCSAADRACPISMGFRCPVHYTAAMSYGVGYVDGADGPGLGATGVAQDEYGNVWCNGA